MYVMFPLQWTWKQNFLPSDSLPQGELSVYRNSHYATNYKEFGQLIPRFVPQHVN